MATDEIYLDALTVLLEKKFDPNAKSEKGVVMQGLTPLFTAVAHQNYQGMSLLINSGAFIDVKTLVAASSMPQVFKLLLESNTAVSLVTESGFSALTEVVLQKDLNENAKLKVAGFLLKHGARPDIAENNEGEKYLRYIYTLRSGRQDLGTQPAIVLAQRMGLKKLANLFKKYVQIKE
jgi:ankyrin repeat protein